MYKTFAQIEEAILKNEKKVRLVLANAHDDDALSAAVHAVNKGVIEAILIGKKEQIEVLLKEFDQRPEDYTIIGCDDEKQASEIAMQMIQEKKAEIPMKGIMQTSTFMRSILNKERGFFDKDSILSQCTVLEWPQKDKMLVISDCAVNISPDLEAKKKIIGNAVKLAHALGYERPNVALLSAVEVLNPKIPSTIDADELSKMEWEDCNVDGPFALDNAIDEEAAQRKGISKKIAGNADVLIVPDLCSGNIFTKSLLFFAHMKSSGALCGADIPAVMTSRSDSPENKYHSILTAVLQYMEA